MLDNSRYNLFDILIESETDTWPASWSMDGAWPGGKQLFKRGILKRSSTAGALIAGDAAIFEDVLQHYGWVHVTTDVMPTPWDTVPTAKSQDIYSAIG